MVDTKTLVEIAVKTERERAITLGVIAVLTAFVIGMLVGMKMGPSQVDGRPGGETSVWDDR